MTLVSSICSKSTSADEFIASPLGPLSNGGGRIRLECERWSKFRNLSSPSLKNHKQNRSKRTRATSCCHLLDASKMPPKLVTLATLDDRLSSEIPIEAKPSKNRILATENWNPEPENSLPNRTYVLFRALRPIIGTIQVIFSQRIATWQRGRNFLPTWQRLLGLI